MVEDPRFRRIAPRPERKHLPFEMGHRHGPLFAPFVGPLVVAVLFGCATAWVLTFLLDHLHAP